MIKEQLESHYDVVVIGSGFGSLFAVEAYRKKFPKSRIAIIERGNYNTQQWQIENNANSPFDIQNIHKTREGEKPWYYTVGFGGGLNCWWAQTPRFHPSDFRTKSLYGKGTDWPLTYSELEPFYVEVEYRMKISGDDSISAVLPRSKPFPQPAHRLTTIDKIMQAAQPNFHFAIPTARSSVVNEERSKCCSTARCNLCPVNAKFTTDNAFAYLLKDSSIDILINAEARLVEKEGQVVKKLIYSKQGELKGVTADFFILGANAIHNPEILLRSGINDYWVGRGLHEQHSVGYEVYLDGLSNFDGGTVTTAINYALYDGAFRANYAGSLIYFENRWSYGLRPEPGKWKHTLPLWLSVEDLPSEENRVVLDNDLPLILHKNISDYCAKGAEAAEKNLGKVLSPLPVEKIINRGVHSTAAHIQGTTRMGESIEDSVVDKHLIHHHIRNLMIVGSSAIPTSSCANPSLTAAALSVFAISRI